MKKLIQFSLILILQGYRWCISPLKNALFGSQGSCRFTPTCSEYALEAIQLHGPGRGVALTARRICRCHPWGGWGPDPVPVENLKLQTPKFTGIAAPSAEAHG